MNNGSVNTDSGPSAWVTIARYILTYAIWFLFCALSFWIIWLVRTNLVEDIFFMRVDPWQLRAIDRWSIWIMGIAWVVAIFLSEGYLRKGLEQGRLLLNAGRLFLIVSIIIALSYLLHAL